MMKTILIVEDNLLNMKLFTDILRANGYATVQSVDGRDIVELARRERADLVIMDMQLPVVSGLVLTRMLKSDEQLKHLPVLAVTAHAVEGIEFEIRRAGCDDYLPKPVSMDDLLETIARHLAPGGHCCKG